MSLTRIKVHTMHGQPFRRCGFEFTGEPREVDVTEEQLVKFKREMAMKDRDGKHSSVLWVEFLGAAPKKRGRPAKKKNGAAKSTTSAAPETPEKFDLSGSDD